MNIVKHFTYFKNMVNHMKIYLFWKRENQLSQKALETGITLQLFLKKALQSKKESKKFGGSIISAGR